MGRRSFKTVMVISVLTLACSSAQAKQGFQPRGAMVKAYHLISGKTRAARIQRFNRSLNAMEQQLKPLQNQLVKAQSVKHWAPRSQVAVGVKSAMVGFSAEHQKLTTEVNRLAQGKVPRKQRARLGALNKSLSALTKGVSALPVVKESSREAPSQRAQRRVPLSERKQLGHKSGTRVHLDYRFPSPKSRERMEPGKGLPREAYNPGDANWQHRDVASMITRRVKKFTIVGQLAKALKETHKLGMSAAYFDNYRPGTYIQQHMYKTIAATTFMGTKGVGSLLHSVNHIADGRKVIGRRYDADGRAWKTEVWVSDKNDKAMVERSRTFVLKDGRKVHQIVTTVERELSNGKHEVKQYQQDSINGGKFVLTELGTRIVSPLKN